MHAVRRRLGHRHFREEVARRRIPAWKVDARGLSYETASTVAPDEILRAHRLTGSEGDVDTSVVLAESHDLAAVDDRHAGRGDPFRENALDMLLAQRESVIVPRREVADVQAG